MEVLYEGTIINQKTRKKFPFYMVRLYAENLPAIEKLQQAVIADLPEKKSFLPLSKENFLSILNKDGLMIGAFIEEEMIGFRALLIPEIDEVHMGHDINLPEEDLPRVIYQEISAVLPSYRGNRLQQKLADIIMKELSTLPGDFRYVCCTVAPMNIPSLKDKFMQNMYIAALTEKYDNKELYVCVKDLESPLQNYQSYVTAKLDNLKKQRQLFDDGYVGIGFQMKEGFHEIQFAKPIL